MVYNHLAGRAENGSLAVETDFRNLTGGAGNRSLIVGFDVGDLFGEAENGSLAEVIDFRDLAGKNCLRSVLQLTRVYCDISTCLMHSMVPLPVIVTSYLWLLTLPHNWISCYLTCCSSMTDYTRSH